MKQAALPLREFDPCRRCGQEPKVDYWEGDNGTPSMNVECACRVLSGEADGMAETWNRAAGRLRETD